jgi:hypothetical protein
MEIIWQKKAQKIAAFRQNTPTSGNRQNVDKSLNAYRLRVCEGQTFRKGVAGLHSLFTRYKDPEHPITFNIEFVFSG